MDLMSGSASSNTCRCCDSLPMELIELILMRMPIRDAVRLSILSRNWRCAWTSSRALAFDDRDFGDLDLFHREIFRFVEFVDSVLSSHDGPIFQFSLSTRGTIFKNVDRWLTRLFKCGNRIQKFRLKINLMEYTVPSLLFSCHEMMHLELINCRINLPQNFEGFQNLKSLHLRWVSISSDELTKLVLSCKKLQRLNLKLKNYDYVINIEETKLQQLILDCHFEHIRLANPHLTSLFIYSKKHVGFPQGLDSLFHCHALVCLELRRVNLTVPKNFKSFEMLETLVLSRVTCSIDDFECLVSKCPRLRVLSMVSLRVPIRSVLHVRSETVQCLRIKTKDYLNIQLETPCLKEFSTDTRDVCDSCIDLLRPPVEHSQELAGIERSIRITPAFSHLEKLSLSMDYGELHAQLAAIYFFEKAHALRKLKLKIRPPPLGTIWKGRTWCFWNEFKCRFNHLVEFKLDSVYFSLHGAEELLLLKLILDNAPVLEKVKIKPGYMYPRLVDEGFFKGLWTCTSLSKKATIMIKQHKEAPIIL